MESEGFGTRLRELRKRAGFSQRELADRIGVDFTYLSKIENGVMPPPSERVILRLAEVLNVDRDELLMLGQKIPPDIVRMLQNPETLQFLRARQNQKRVMPLRNIKIPGLRKFKSLTRVALAVTLVASIGVSLWFVSPVKALDITFPTPPTSGTLGSSHSFSVKVTLNDAELLPIQDIELEIYSVANSATYKARIEDLPLTATGKSYTSSQTGGGAASVTATTNNWDWGYGYGYVAWEGTPQYFGYGYGYGTGVGSITYVVTWASPAGWPNGEYKVKTTISAGSKTFTKTSSSFTLTSPPVVETQTTPPLPPVSIVVEEGVAVISNVVSDQGLFTRDVIIQSEDATITLDIDKNTVGKTKEGSVLTTITTATVANPPAPPEKANIVGLTYDFGPSGATFNPPITITFTYNPNDIPAGTAEADLVVAWWNEETGKWVILEGATVDPITNTISAPTSHFTKFAVITRPPAAPAAFSIDSLAISPESVSTGQAVTISAVVTNTGGLRGEYEVIIKINNVVVERRTVTLDGGIGQRVTFTTTQDVAGTYLVDIGGATGTFTVQTVTLLPRPAVFATSSLGISPKTIDIGQAATISAVVTNTGELSGDYKVTLNINNVAVETKTITLNGRSSQTVTFTITQNLAGIYAVSIDGLSGTLTVKAPQSSPTPVTPPVNWWLIVSVIGVVIAVAAVIWLVVRRPRASE